MDDDLRPEYDFSQMTIVRGKHAQRRGQPHTVTIHNGDGTGTIQYFDAQGTQIREEQHVSIEPTHPIKTIVTLEPDVAALFPDDASVNEALRLMIRLMQNQSIRAV